jgi:hypothetical protein
MFRKSNQDYLDPITSATAVRRKRAKDHSKREYFTEGTAQSDTETPLGFVAGEI